MKTLQYRQFITTVQAFYKTSGRHDLPWRNTTDPYKIAVSELMLQQTQVSRVIEKYQRFLQTFPTVQDLAAAPLSQVLQLWVGLGYNRRAKFLHQMAQVVVSDYGGIFPKDIATLKMLPGVGAYTASAIAAFAYDIPSVCIETNIRTVYIHHFFTDQKDVSDAQLLPLIEKTLPTSGVRQWYWALMDYGSYLKTQGIKTHRVSAGYKKQAAFKGSLRQVRGAIIRTLTETKQPLGKAALADIAKSYDKEQMLVVEVCDALVAEGFLIKKQGVYRLV